MKKFSVLKLLFSIVCSVIVTVFCGNIIWNIENDMFSYTEAKVLDGMTDEPQFVIDMLKPLSKKVNEGFDNHKTTYNYGDEYTEGMFLLNHLSSMKMQRVEFIFKCVLLGVILGMVIYMIAIQKATGKKLVLELIIGFIFLCLIIVIINLGYGVYFEKLVEGTEYNITNIQTNIYDLGLNKLELGIGFVALVLIIYIGHMVYNKMIVKKLNNELNNK